MKRVYIFNFSESAGSRAEIKKWIEQETKIVSWRYDLPNCFYLVSESKASELSHSFVDFNGKKGRHLIAEITENRQGLLTSDSWTFMKRRKYNMQKLSVNDLIYKDEYVNSASAVSDDPKVIFSDSKRLNRKEKYEILHFLNALTAKENGELSQRTRRICEWLIHEHLPKEIQNTKEIKKWIGENYKNFVDKYPFKD